MTPPVTLLSTARGLGVRVERNGLKLRVVADVPVPPDEWSGLVAGLAEFKAEVLEILDVEASGRVCPPDAPTWPPRPNELGSWPIALRQRWADLTARHEDAGLDWREAEARAFEEMGGEAGPHWQRPPTPPGPDVDPAFATDEALSITPERVAAIMGENRMYQR